METSPGLINVEEVGSTHRARVERRSMLAPEGKRALRETLVAAPVLLAFLSGALFAFGWSYLYVYYRFFGVDLYSLDLPGYDFLIASLWELPQSFSILQKTFLAAGFCGLFALIGSAIFGRFEVRMLLGKLFRSNRRSESAPTSEHFQAPGLGLSLLRLAFIGFALLLGVQFVVFLGGDVDQRARNAAKVFFDNPDLKTVLTFKREALPFVSRDLVQANAAGALRPVVQTKDAIVVFVKREVQPAPRTFMVPLSNLLSIQNEPLNSAKLKAESQ